MSDWGEGFAAGILVGLVIGIFSTRKQKPWSEMTDREQKARIAMMIVLATALVVGIIVLLLAGT